VARDRSLAQAWSWLPDRYQAFAVMTSGQLRTTHGMGAHLVGAAA
jgi:hypothetical protein